MRTISVSRKMERRLRRYRGQMLCDWCHHWSAVPCRGKDGATRSWSDVPFDKWVEFATKHAVFHCRRPSCLQARDDCTYRSR